MKKKNYKMNNNDKILIKKMRHNQSFKNNTKFKQKSTKNASQSDQIFTSQLSPQINFVDMILMWDAFIQPGIGKSVNLC